MVVKKGKHKRSKTLTILLLPVLVFIFIAGWVMCIVGDEKTAKRQVNPPTKDNVTLLPIVPEEEQKIRNSS